MNKKTIFRGIATALITPFSGGEIDYPALRHLIDMQIDGGVNALLIGGTTAEVCVMSTAERRALYEYAVDYIAGRLPVILGTGTNDTALTIENTRYAKALGADAALIVAPYYNKGTYDGLKMHYLSVAEKADMPIIVYNVPQRTGVNLDIGLLGELAECDNIVGIKECSDSAERLFSLSLMCDKLPLYSGNDSMTYLNLTLGGSGTISVCSNILVQDMCEICNKYFQGDKDGAKESQGRLMKFIAALFADTNPSPIKYIMSEAGLCRDEVRLPLSVPREELKNKLLMLWQELNIQL